MTLQEHLRKTPDEQERACERRRGKGEREIVMDGERGIE